MDTIAFECMEIVLHLQRHFPSQDMSSIYGSAMHDSVFAPCSLLNQRDTHLLNTSTYLDSSAP